MSDLCLDSDEFVIIDTPGIVHPKQSSGVRAILNSNPLNGDLILTNKNIFFKWSSGTFLKTTKFISMSLADIKVFNGLAQVIMSKPKYYGGRIPVTFYLSNDEKTFEFNPYSKTDIKNWIESVNEILTGVRCGYNSENKLSYISSENYDISTKKNDSNKMLKNIYKLSLNDQIDAINELNDLLKKGILSQEEFDNKKKEILGLQ